jgi:hypothetical protein
LTYSGNYGHYFSNPDLDFNDHALVATANARFTSRADVLASAFYLRKQDAPGSVDRAFTGTPDRWHAVGADGTFGYGATSAQGRLEFDLGFTDKRYLNNRESTELLDVSTWNAAARFFYRVAPKTRLLAEIRHTDYDYRSSASPLDNSEQRYLLGATWEATAATSGTVKVGYIAKEFRQQGPQDHRGPTGEAEIRWLPRTFSAVDISLQYAPSDSTGTGFFTIDKSVGARWEHHWKSYFVTRALASYVKSDYEGVSRTDRIGRVSLAAYFDVRTWLRLGAEVSHENRRSTDTLFDFSRNVILLTVAGTV